MARKKKNVAENRKKKISDTRAAGVICVLFGGVLLAGTVKQQIDLPDEQKLAQTAVYLENAELLPENEGKLVILTGTVEMSGDTVDALTGLSFDVPVLYRVVEEYTLDTGYAVSEWTWTQIHSNDPNDVDCDFVCSDAVTIGDFVIGSELLEQFPRETIYTRYQEDELAYAGLETQQDGDTVYLAADGDNATAWNHTSLLGLFSNGDVRISYECYDTSVTPEVTMIGYQTGDTLTLASVDEISFPDVMAGQLTQEEFIEAVSGETTEGSLLAVVLGLAVCALGVYWIVSYYRKRAVG